MNSQALVKINSVANPRARLICFPYAGGNASAYRQWSCLSAQDIEVIAIQPPGRSARINEPPYDNIQAMVNELLPVVLALSGVPYFVFGHSLGSRIAYAVLSEIQRLSAALPECFFVSASRAAHQGKAQSCYIHQLPDNELITAISRLNGTPEVILRDAEFMQMLLPMFRADFKIAETYIAPVVKLQCPIQGFCGVDDDVVKPQQMACWQELTTEFLGVKTYAGGHFYLEPGRQALLHDLRQQIEPNLIFS
ncbi:thioesterase [Saccharobesus litoralis]|uniref:Thioesterase n=1 Tax=Saccharobesus litoralis TaxID=2172099 RepID=A0A2S0VNB1_9ALTE|nr:thioesterase domain-containing protein [Saccharobesus litoralis]AWB65707.1 thioesterase [Saccharobesus litoralis]